MELKKVPPFCEFRSNTNNSVTGVPGVTDRFVRFEKATCVCAPENPDANVAKGVGGVVPLNKPLPPAFPVVCGYSLALETSVFEFMLPPAVKVTPATDTGWFPVADSTI